MMQMKYIFIIILILIALGGIWLAVRRSNSGALSVKSPATSENAGSTPLDNGSESLSTPTPKPILAAISTVRGDIVLELYPWVAPKTVSNFVKLSQEKFYDGTKFHRVIADFMIQGGDPLSRDNNLLNDGTGGPGYTFEDEINPRTIGMTDNEINELLAMGYAYNFTLQSMPVAVGAIAMANAGPNTNGSQFFIVTVQDQPHLNGRHTVFGKVIKGMDVVRKIQQGDKIITIKVAQ